MGQLHLIGEGRRRGRGFRWRDFRVEGDVGGNKMELEKWIQMGGGNVGEGSGMWGVCT